MTAPAPVMPSYVDVFRPLVDKLTAAGIRVTEDFTKIHPPCVYITAPTVSFRFGKCEMDVDYSVLVITGRSDQAHSIQALSDLLDQVLPALDFAPQTATPTTISTSDSSTPLPALELTWSARARAVTTP